jgi:hypothetical protein
MLDRGIIWFFAFKNVTLTVESNCLIRRKTVVFRDVALCSFVNQFQHVGALPYLVWYMVPTFLDITLLFGIGYLYFGI